MQFGVQFFPDVGPEEVPAARYFADCLEVAVEAERVGFTHARIVEHYFHPYGGYSPNPLVFLAALSQRTQRLRLVTGALLPVFNNPLKLAGEIAMVDALSEGRIDLGFARAFLPHEFRRFGISPDESVARFREGLEQIELLLCQENVTHIGKFRSIVGTTSLPRPTQKPRPKIFIAAVNTPESFDFAGERGYSIMAIPIGERLRELVARYRAAWRAAGHPGNGEVMLAFHMYCEPEGAAARKTAKPFIDHYFQSMADAVSDWVDGMTSVDYPGYDKMFQKVREMNMESQLASGAAWVGSPAEVRAIAEQARERFGDFDHASLQINFNQLPLDKALASLRLFATTMGLTPFASPAR